MLALTNCNAGPQSCHTPLLLTLSAKCLSSYNKANLKDLIAVTGLVILLKLDSNHRFFSPCDLEIWWMTSKKRAPLLYYIKLCTSFHSHQWIQTGVKSLGIINSGQNRRFFFYLEIWRMTLKKALLCCFRFCAPLQSYGWMSIQTGVTVRKPPILVKIGHFCPVWPWNLHWLVTLKNNKAPLLCGVKLHSSFHSYQVIQSGVTVRKLPIRIKTGIFCPVWPWNSMNDLEKQ